MSCNTICAVEDDLLVRTVFALGITELLKVLMISFCLNLTAFTELCLVLNDILLVIMTVLYNVGCSRCFTAWHFRSWQHLSQPQHALSVASAATSSRQLAISGSCHAVCGLQGWLLTTAVDNVTHLHAWIFILSLTDMQSVQCIDTARWVTWRAFGIGQFAWKSSSFGLGFLKTTSVCLKEMSYVDNSDGEEGGLLIDLSSCVLEQWGTEAV